MPLDRILEPEVMDSAEEARDYDAMDHSEVNRRFVDDLLAALRVQGSVFRRSSKLNRSYPTCCCLESPTKQTTAGCFAGG